MNALRLGHALHPLEIHRRWEIPASSAQSQGQGGLRVDWKRVEIRGLDDARHAIAHGGDQAEKWRNFLGHDCYNLSRMSDAEVMKQVAVMLCRGALVLFEQIMTDPVRYSLRNAIAEPKASGVNAMTPSTCRVRAEEPAEQAPVPLCEEATFLQHDQDAQAATLELAALNGIPFCEICNKLKRERIGPLWSQEAA